MINASIENSTHAKVSEFDHGKANIRCPYCGGASAHLVSSTDVNRNTTTQIFEYFRCLSCELVFLDPIPQEMGRFYAGGYQAIPPDLPSLRAVAKKEAYKVDTILKYKKRGRLLEIGPWMGMFSSNAKDAGFDVTAIEMDQNCVNFLQTVIGVKAIQSSEPAKTLNALSEQFDVVALWHSLEHLPDPWLVLQRAAELLKPGGVLLIAIPNIQSYDFSVLRAEWFHLDAPRHLYFFPISWLEKFCSANGLSTLELTTVDQLGQMVSLEAWLKKSSLMIPIRYVRRILGLFLYQFAKRKYKKDRYSGGGLTALFIKS
jgi:SAM-dependent methyltransferase